MIEYTLNQDKVILNHYLTTGDTYDEICEKFNIGKGKVYNIISKYMKVEREYYYNTDLQPIPMFGKREPYYENEMHYAFKKSYVFTSKDRESKFKVDPDMLDSNYKNFISRENL